MLVIGITGRARSGKGVIAEAIQEACIDRYDCKVYEISELVLNDLKKKGSIDPSTQRKDLTKEELSLLVQHGLTIRSMNKEFWIEKLYYQIRKDQPQVAVLPSIRFENEAELIVNGFLGKIIRVKRFVRDGVEFISTDRDPNSPMETENLNIKANYILTAGPNQVNLLKAQARTLFEYILNEEKDSQ